MTKDETINRRGFLAAGMEASLGLAVGSLPLRMVDSAVNADQRACGGSLGSPYARRLAGTRELEYLGRPRDWALVGQGLHPFSPERVVLIPEDTRLRMTDDDFNALRTDLVACHRHRSKDTEQKVLDLCDSKKGELCIRLMKVMADYYQSPQCFAEWAMGLLRREAIAATSFGDCGLVHQFQGAEPVMPRNRPADWWLFLAPGGVDFQALDEKPIYLLAGIVMQHDCLSGHQPGIEIGSLELISSVLYREADRRGISRLDPMAAARRLNTGVLSLLQDRMSAS